MDIVKTGSTWILRTAPILDATGARLTGLTDIKFSVSRYTSGAWQWLDTADMTFRASPAGYQFTMTAVDASKAAGVYAYALDMSTITNVTFGDQLFIDIQQTTLTNAINANQEGGGVYGEVVDKVEANLTVATSTLATSTALATAQADISAIMGAGFTGGTDDLHSAHTLQATLATSAALATAQGNITTILGYGAPPSAATISTQVNADITTAHGAGSYQTASTAGLATATNVSDATTAINAHTDSAVSTLATEAALDAVQIDITAIMGAGWGVGDNLHTIAAFGAPPSAATVSAQVASDLAVAHGAGSWATATSVGLSAGALTATAIGAGYVSAIQSGLATSAALATMQGNVTTILGYGAPPTAAANAAEVWATAYGTPSASTFGWLLYRLGQWGTEICQKRIVGQNLLLQSIGGATTYVTVPLKDVNSGVITPGEGEPAQYLPTA